MSEAGMAGGVVDTYGWHRWAHRSPSGRARSSGSGLFFERDLYGRGRVLFVLGEAGLGKTTLLDQAVKLAPKRIDMGTAGRTWPKRPCRSDSRSGLEEPCFAVFHP